MSSPRRTVISENRAIIARKYAEVCETIQTREQELVIMNEQREQLEMALLSGATETPLEFSPPIAGTKEAKLLAGMVEEPGRNWELKELLVLGEEKNDTRAARNRLRRTLYSLIRRGGIKKTGQNLFRVYTNWLSEGPK